MMYNEESQCEKCVNFSIHELFLTDDGEELFVCNAFPKGIPSQYYNNKNNHTVPNNGFSYKEFVGERI